MKLKTLALAVVLFGAAATAVSTTNHLNTTKDKCCDPPFCLPGDPSPPCPEPPSQ